MKNHIITILLFLNPFLFAYYEYGDSISIEDQSYPLNVCYGDYPDEILRLSDFNGDSKVDIFLYDKKAGIGNLYGWKNEKKDFGSLWKNKTFKKTWNVFTVIN